MGRSQAFIWAGSEKALLTAAYKRYKIYTQYAEGSTLLLNSIVF